LFLLFSFYILEGSIVCLSVFCLFVCLSSFDLDFNFDYSHELVALLLMRTVLPSIADASNIFFFFFFV